MPWVVGIDEAGYGPNLGPLVQAAVALRLPDDDLAGWETLKPWVRRAHEKDDGRLLIDDSKKVYAGARGFEKLERGVLGALQLKWIMLGEFVSFLGLTGSKADVDTEPWFDGTSYLETQTVLDPSIAFMGRSHVVPPTRFNRILDVHHSKAVVLSQGLIELMRDAAGSESDEPMHFICDKQGGRNFYAPLLQETFPDGWVVAERESAAESRYRILNLNREVTVVFRPKADGDSACVALASMICKYLRELCMGQFNTFWQKHVPGLQPTAGYPVDAKRFYAEIRPAMEKLGIPPDSVWRKK